MDKRQKVLDKLADYCIKRMENGEAPVPELELYLEHTRTDCQKGVLLGGYGLEAADGTTAPNEKILEQLKNAGVLDRKSSLTIDDIQLQR